MNTRLLSVACCLAALAASSFAADQPEKKQASEAEIRARLEDHLLKKRTEAAKAAEAEKKSPESNAAAPVAKTDAPPAQPAPAATPAPQAAQATPPEEPTVLPKFEVKKEKITELDRQLAKQNKEIAREKENTKPTALDDAINGPKVSKIFALFGGQSSDDRSNISKERVAMMEEERDLIEAIAQAQTKEEKAELQKTLDDMRAMRRELEQSLR